VRRGLRLLVCGINPSPASAGAGIGYFRNGNRFWSAAVAAGLASRDRDPDYALAHDGLGFTDLVARVEADAAKLGRGELEEGALEVEALVRKYKPAATLFTSITAYRTAIDRKAAVGVQPLPFGGRPAYVMPSTSGRNASTPLAALIDHMRAAATLADTSACAQANASWCAVHGGVRGRRLDTYWYASRRTAEFHPDAITLHPVVDVEEMLRRIDSSPGASVKDSWASIDLSPHGFEVLLEGDWYRGDFGPKGTTDWFTRSEAPKAASRIHPMRVWIKPS
jgi:TDG/mug DNA glycosylase family protein